MKQALDLYGTLLRVAIAGNIQYRAAGMVWMLGMVIEPVIYLVVWSAVADSRGESVAGYDARDFAAYYLTFFVLHHLTFTWIMEVFQYRVQQGSLSFELLRPIHPIYADIADNVAYKLVMLVVMIPAAVVIALAFEPRFQPVGWSLALLPIAVVLAFFTRFFLEWGLAMSAFWTTRTTAVNRTYYSIYLFLSGRAAPIALLPAWLSGVAEHLPFYAMIGFPVELALGKLSPERALSGLGVQLVWTLFALGFVAMVWRRAVRRFSAVGG
ncbi:MAG: ABC-2 family transporter protein [Myxococcales bacterium]|nr:ABC-2 family transporter protein [Myxococcales bacterium]